MSDQLLETYQQERAPDVMRCTGMSIALGRIIKRELSEAEESAARPAPGSKPQVAIVPAPFLHGGWLAGPIAHMNALGKMIPQPQVAAGNGRLALLDTVIGEGFVLLGDQVDPATLLNAQERAQWDRLGAQYIKVLTPDQIGTGAGDIIDIEGTLTAWLREHGARVVAVRPDRFVAATDVSGFTMSCIAAPAFAELVAA